MNLVKCEVCYVWSTAQDINSSRGSFIMVICCNAQAALPLSSVQWFTLEAVLYFRQIRKQHPSSEEAFLIKNYNKTLWFSVLFKWFLISFGSQEKPCMVLF